MEEVQIVQEVQVDEAILFDVDGLKQAQDAQAFKMKQDAQAFGASVTVTLKPVTNDTSVTVTNDTDTNVTTETDPWLLPSEAALILGVTRKTIRDWYNKKILKGMVTGGGQHLRVRTSEVYRLQGLRYIPPAVDIYKDPRVLAEAQSSFDTEDANSIFSVAYLQKDRRC